MKDKYKPIITKICLEQPPDNCDETDEYQSIEIGFHDGGGGSFWRIEKVDRWAVDVDDAAILVRWLNGIAARNDNRREA